MKAARLTKTEVKFTVIVVESEPARKYQGNHRKPMTRNTGRPKPYPKSQPPPPFYPATAPHSSSAVPPPGLEAGPGFGKLRVSGFGFRAPGLLLSMGLSCRSCVRSGDLNLNPCAHRDKPWSGYAQTQLEAVGPCCPTKPCSMTPLPSTIIIIRNTLPSSILGDLKINLWGDIQILKNQKG